MPKVHLLFLIFYHNTSSTTTAAPPPPPGPRRPHRPRRRRYNSKDGDLDAIFKELGDDPGKAKKYPPADATVFARK